MLFYISEPRQISVIRKMHAMFSRPSAETMEQIGKQFNNDTLYVMPYSIRQALELFASQVKLPEKSAPKSPPWLSIVSVNHHGEYTNTELRRFKLGAWICSAGKWRDLVRNTCDILYIEHPEKFSEIAFKITGPKRDYFSKDRTGLKDPHRIADGVFVETNLSANNSVEFVNLLAEAFGYDRPVLNPAL